MNGIRWWNVACTACRWSGTRQGTHGGATKNTCPRCGAPVTAAPGSAPGSGGQLSEIPGR
jgi:hypothetical protein